jgi:DNA-nicking Smr family endonuclease
VTNDRRRRLVSSEEVKLWREVMRGTKKLARRTTTEDGETDPPPPPSSPSSRPSPRPAVTRQPERDAEPPPSSERDRTPRISLSLRPAVAPQLDHRRAPGLDKSTAGRFAKGQMQIDATIDLHGLTQPVAHAALARFVIGGGDLGRRCLLVITGKGNREGTGVLRAEVPRWLNEPGLRERILAFTYAQPKDGGQGALYVLLKRRR